MNRWTDFPVFHLARHLPPRQEGYPQPQPVILDPSLRLPTDCKLLKNATEGKGKVPVVFCGPPSVDHEMQVRMSELMELGARIITLPLDAYGVCEHLWSGTIGTRSDLQQDVSP